MKKRILLLTKDALCKSYLPIYGNSFWSGKTPNIDELAQKGTVFNKYYTAAPSTVMAFRSMMTGKFAHETQYSNYTPLEIPESEKDFMSIARDLGYSNHILWDEEWNKMVLRYGNCYGKQTVIHSIQGLRQGVGCHYCYDKPLTDNDDLSDLAIDKLMDEVKSICSHDEKIMLWIHLPHVINGRTGYGTDIDLFDIIVGKLRGFFDDDAIFISADHGNMNGYKGKYCYGFDVYESAIQIPLITPLIDGFPTCDWNVSNVDIGEIVFNRHIPQRNVIYCDSAYYAQPDRKCVVLSRGYKFIHNKRKKTDELYDLSYDETERCNLIADRHYDSDRHMMTNTREVYFYPKWDELPIIRKEMCDQFQRIWRTATPLIEFKEKMLFELKKIAVVLKTKFLRRK